MYKGERGHPAGFSLNISASGLAAVTPLATFTVSFIKSEVEEGSLLAELQRKNNGEICDKTTHYLVLNRVLSNLIRWCKRICIIFNFPSKRCFSLKLTVIGSGS